ncbi:hypothetical protein COCNU_07G014270 [Cocos nucifera]|uniref:Uncharacterized protein n=1 Tax=Cocos nucifera TaxID=13894 RepID=A0A8K0IG35_COCNU|nr:hypothetical protein COCNU_07G014270 [Cocos nucifera]
MTDDDEVIKLRSTDIYNHAYLRCMGYIFKHGVWRRMSEVPEEKCDSEEDRQSTDRDQVTHPPQFDQQSFDLYALSAQIDLLEISVKQGFALMDARLNEKFA